MEHGRRAILGLALMGGMSRVLAAPPRNPQAVLDAELAAIANDPVCQLSSVSVLAIRQGKVVYQKELGQRYLGGGGVGPKPANHRTLYRIASISKMMTTLGAMLLVEQGKLALDTDIGDYLGFAVRNPGFPQRALTLRALLTHTSTLRDTAGYSWPIGEPISKVLEAGSAAWAANAPPGDYFTYSNLNWGVIGTIMEKVTNERFDLLMKRLLLDPLGMRGGYYPGAFSAEELDNTATLYRKRTTDTEIWNSAGPWIAQVDDYHSKAPVRPDGIANYQPGINATPFSPTGGLRVSAADMGKVMLMLMNRGRHEGRVIFKPATLARMFTRQWTADGKGGNGDTDKGLFNAWGMGNQHFLDQPGMQMVEDGGFAGVGHLGEAYGLMSVFAADLERKNGMIVLVGGVSSDPAAYKGKHSAMARFEERILTALHRRAILGSAA